MEAKGEKSGLEAVEAGALAHLATDLEDRAISMYLADPSRHEELRQILEGAIDQVRALAATLPTKYKCPAGTVPCRRGCCYPHASE